MDKAVAGFPITIGTSSQNYTEIELCVTKGCSAYPCVKTGNCKDDICVCPSINYVCWLIQAFNPLINIKNK
ncbi:MAG: hypothetical protein ACEPOV_08895 [Hyphomicrobiales bacterium]